MCCKGVEYAGGNGRMCGDPRGQWGTTGLGRRLDVQRIVHFIPKYRGSRCCGEDTLSAYVGIATPRVPCPCLPFKPTIQLLYPPHPLTPVRPRRSPAFSRPTFPNKVDRGRNPRTSALRSSDHRFSQCPPNDFFAVRHGPFSPWIDLFRRWNRPGGAYGRTGFIA